MIANFHGERKDSIYRGSAGQFLRALQTAASKITGPPVRDWSTCDAPDDLRAGPLPGTTDVTDTDLVVSSTEREGELCHAQ